MVFLRFLIIFLNIIPTAISDTCDDFRPSRAFDEILEYNDYKCIYLTKSPYPWSLGNTTGCSTNTRPLSIDSEQENEAVKQFMEKNGINNAYIGYVNYGGTWQWDNGDPSTYQNFAPNEEPSEIPFTTALPTHTTLPPANQHKPISVVLAIDAGIYAAGSIVEQELEFARKLGDYVSARGPTSFAYFIYGCNSFTDISKNFPDYLPLDNSYEKMLEMTSNLSAYYMESCTKNAPLLLPKMMSDSSAFYYDDYYAIRKAPTERVALIILSTTKNLDDVTNTDAFSAINNWPVIAISVGQGAASISKLAIPSSNYRAISDFSNMDEIIETVYSLIFQNPPQLYKQVRRNDELATVPPSSYSFMNTSDGFWYVSDGKALLNILCEHSLPEPSPATDDPNEDWKHPCPNDGFTYYQELTNAKCYKVSSDAKSFAESMSSCLERSPTHIYENPVLLTSLETESEVKQMAELVNNVPNEGMFWIGLYYSKNEKLWKWVNGMEYNEENTPWRDGYPRSADGSYCSVYLPAENKIINTYCNQRLYSICSYRFNSTM